MGSSLLAYLFPYIKGSQEDIATYSLQYLLSQSNKMNKMFVKFTCDLLNLPILESISFIAQNTGESEDK